VAVQRGLPFGGKEKVFSISGQEEMVKKIRALQSSMPQLIANALYEEAELIMTASKKICPVDLGTLKTSGDVNKPKIKGKKIWIEMGYGGSAKAYAWIQHENLSFRHTKGQSAKFLEKPFLAAVSGMVNRIAKALSKEMSFQRHLAKDPFVQRNYKV
jgi:hypothetical protein